MEKKEQLMASLFVLGQVASYGSMFESLRPKHFEHEKGEYSGIALPCKHKKSRAKRKGKKSRAKRKGKK